MLQPTKNAHIMNISNYKDDLNLFKFQHNVNTHK
jgi:hypothetical protein